MLHVFASYDYNPFRPLYHIKTHLASPCSVKFTRLFNILQVLDLDEDDIIPDLAHIAEGYDKFLFPTEDPAQAARPRHDQMCNAAGLRVKLHIAHKTEAPAVADVDHFFFFKSKIRIACTLNFLGVFYAYFCHSVFFTVSSE